MASTRNIKGKAAASSSHTLKDPAEREYPQIPVTQPERQLESDDDDTPEPATSEDLLYQVQALARNQSATESTLQLILQRIAKIGATSPESNSRSTAQPIPVHRTTERDTPESNHSFSLRHSKKLPDPSPLSDGKDPSFLSWKIQIQGKFRSNADHYNDEEARMLYVFSRTSGDAQKHLQPRYDEDSQTRFTTAKEMLTYLASIYVNPNLVRDSRAQYNSLFMRNGQTFAEFQTQFLHLASEAEVPRESLRMDLYDRITTTLQRGIAPNLRLLSTYEDLAADITSLDSEYRRIAAREDSQKRFQDRQARRPSILTQASSGSLAANNASLKASSPFTHPPVRTRSETPRTEPRRPALVDATVNCFNCKKPGHYATTCPEPRKGDIKEIEESLYEEAEEIEQTEESGNDEP